MGDIGEQWREFLLLLLMNHFLLRHESHEVRSHLPLMVDRFGYLFEGLSICRKVGSG